ncbi:MAG: hypothetical protein II737_03245, partial [Mailhella sp.]|nr:hypothetical protein [Mailhella sp.]
MEELKIGSGSGADGERMEKEIAGASTEAAGGNDAASPEAAILPVKKKAAEKKKVLKQKKAVPNFAESANKTIA